jgi:hypothetical protein
MHCLPTDVKAVNYRGTALAFARNPFLTRSREGKHRKHQTFASSWLRVRQRPGAQNEEEFYDPWSLSLERAVFHRETAIS